MNLWQRLSLQWRRMRTPALPSRVLGSESFRQGRWRLLVLLLLFDVLLVATVLLSFQGNELIEEEVTLLQTRQVYDVEIRQQVVTRTTVITRIIPYGSQP